MSTQALADVELVYLGRATIVGGKNGARFITVEQYRQMNHEGKTAQDMIEESSIFACKDKDLPRAIGVVYVVKGETDQSNKIQRMSGSPRFDTKANDGVHVREDFVAIWQALDDAIVVERRARKKLEEYGKDNKAVRALANLRRDYMSTDSVGRLALEVVVLKYLRSGI